MIKMLKINFEKFQYLRSGMNYLKIFYNHIYY